MDWNPNNANNLSKPKQPTRSRYRLRAGSERSLRSFTVVAHNHNPIIRIMILVSLIIMAGCTLELHRVQAEAEFAPLIATLADELNLTYPALRAQDPSQYAPIFYLQYEVRNRQVAFLDASFGSLTRDQLERKSYLDIDLRVGSPDLDNTHPLRDRGGRGGRGDRRDALEIPFDEDGPALKRVLRLATDQAYKAAQEKYQKVLADIAVKVEEEDRAPDFAPEPAHTYAEPIPRLESDFTEWRGKLETWSAQFNAHSHITSASIGFDAVIDSYYFVNSEGSKIQTVSRVYHLVINAEAVADDGMKLELSESFYAPDLQTLVSEQTVLTTIQELAVMLADLKTAPLAEPYIGPAILNGKSAGVFFHEIFGHRIEGFRQKYEHEGKTFAKKVGESILPDFLSVYDDPTLPKLGAIHLRGHYRYDNEGVPAQRVTVVDNGVLKDFLLSRSPLNDSERSNGHGRRSPGLEPIARQGNLIIEATKINSLMELRAMLIAECRRQNKPYGLWFQNIQGGFTQTRRSSTQGFKVIPLIVYRVYTDGRPDELVRGADIVGTPLTSFSKIIAAGNDPTVFNGTCGAESGWVPVSAVAPSILVSEIEIAKKAKAHDKPPLLPPPAPTTPPDTSIGEEVK